MEGDFEILEEEVEDEMNQEVNHGVKKRGVKAGTRRGKYRQVPSDTRKRIIHRLLQSWRRLEAGRYSQRICRQDGLRVH